MSEIRVNTIVAAEGTSAPNLPYGVSVPTGMGITGAGGINVSGAATVAAGTFSGAVNIDDTTDSTSSTSGALIVDGGLGVAKNVYIGAGLSIAGTLTYEDVTNVDAVGLITAQSGVNISGGELKVGSALTVSGVGVATFIGAAGVAVTITPSTGKVQATVFEGPLTGNVTGDVTGDLTGAASQVTVTDNESTNENNLITFVADGGTSTGSHGLEMDGDLTYTPSLGRLTATQLSGTLQTAAQTNITSVGTLAGLTVSSGGEFKVGTGITMTSTTGVATFSSTVTFANPTDGGKYAQWVPASDKFQLQDSTNLSLGSGDDLKLYHSGAHSYIDNTGSGNLYIRAGTDNSIWCEADGAVKVYWDNATRYETTGAGSTSVGISTVQDFSSMGMLKERVKIVGNKLSAANNIDLKDGNLYYFSTNETTTATPNIRYDGSTDLNDKMLIGETVTISIIYKPNGAGYYAALNVDGSGVTEEWNGGSAPSAANAGGYDVLVHTLTKIGNDSWLCLSNVSNFA